MLNFNDAAIIVVSVLTANLLAFMFVIFTVNAWGPYIGSYMGDSLESYMTESFEGLLRGF